MFSIFKKAKLPVKSQQELITEIHESFDLAAEKALSEAKLIISLSSPRDLDLAVALSKAGFVNTQTVKEGMAAKEETEKAAKQAEIVLDYQKAYPNNKFIFKDQVLEICEKYGLILGPVDCYTGNIPTKNALEITQFHVHDNHVRRDQYYVVPKEERTGWDTKYTYGDPLDNETSLSTKSYSSRDKKIPMYICAPKADMILKKGDKSKGLTISRTSTIIENDPIVLHFVKEGFLVVSKWGLEGQDPALVNEKHN